MLSLERRIEADLACGRHAEVAAEAGGLADANPLREGPRRLHMHEAGSGSAPGLAHPRIRTGA